MIIFIKPNGPIFLRKATNSIRVATNAEMLVARAIPNIPINFDSTIFRMILRNIDKIEFTTGVFVSFNA